ncbi:MAG: hypothetical protein QM278_11745 [Pseudomonadota bacterium]|nr:hypothetical protein [Pseudomonadota bacterium]
MSSWYGYPPYVSVGEKRAKAAAKLKKLQKTDPHIQPVVLAGSAIATTWWGKSWNRNLERYADYANRIGRGRSYVRHGAVLDLRIRAGEVTALVQGTRSQPYSVKIAIERLSPRRWEAVKAAGAGRLASLPELLAGKFPRELGEIFMEEGQGLFPTPREIRFSCSCPDLASMCKHVAAALYGIGARLDKDPGLFFALRGVEIGELVAAAVTDTTRDLLKKAGRQSRRVLTGVDLSCVFGIELDEGAGKTVAVAKPAGHGARETAPHDCDRDGGGETPPSLEKAARSSRPSGAAKKVVRKSPPPAAPKQEFTRPKPTKIPAAQRSSPPMAGRTKKAAMDDKPATGLKSAAAALPPLELVAGFILRSRKGIDTATLVKKTGLAASQIRGIVQRLRMSGRIATLSRGIYGAPAGQG